MQAPDHGGHDHQGRCPTIAHGTIITQSAPEAQQWLATIATIAANQRPPTTC